jgi:hypothetical protein
MCFDRRLKTVISFGQQIENSSYFENADAYRRFAPIGVGEKHNRTIEKFMSETFGSRPLPTAVQTSSAATLSIIQLPDSVSD